jgi:nuclear pore complex protein Nup205
MADLARYIQDLLANPNPQQDLSELQVQLSKFRPTFFNLLDSPPKNSKEKDELDKGTITILMHIVS